MKDLDKYKTYQAIEKDMLKEGISRINTGYMEGPPNNYWGRSTLSVRTSINPFSCAIPEWGGFTQGSLLSKYWPWFIKYNLLRTKQKYIRCSTTDHQDVELEEGLLMNGFLPTGQVMSNHGRYMVTMWEWWPK